MEPSNLEQPSSSTSSPSPSVPSGPCSCGGPVETKAAEPYYLDVEEVFIISQKYRDGGWNKIVKSQEQWWYDYSEALTWLDMQPGWFKQANAIFKVTMVLTTIEKVFDGKELVTPA